MRAQIAAVGHVALRKVYIPWAWGTLHRNPPALENQGCLVQESAAPANRRLPSRSWYPDVHYQRPPFCRKCRHTPGLTHKPPSPLPTQFRCPWPGPFALSIGCQLMCHSRALLSPRNVDACSLDHIRDCHTTACAAFSFASVCACPLARTDGDAFLAGKEAFTDFFWKAIPLKKERLLPIFNGQTFVRYVCASVCACVCKYRKTCVSVTTVTATIHMVATILMLGLLLCVHTYVHCVWSSLST